MSRSILLALAFTAMAATSNLQIYSVLTPSIADDLARSAAFVGGMRTISAVVSILLAAPLGRLSDKMPRKRLILAGYLLLALTGILGALTVNVYWLVAYALVAGMAEITLLPLVQAAIGDYERGEVADRAAGVVIGSFGLSGIIIAPLAVALADLSSWRVSMGILVAIATVGFIGVYRLLPTVAVEQGNEPEALNLRLLRSKPGLVPMLVSNWMRFAIHFGIILFIAAYFTDVHGVADGRVGIYFSIGSMMFLLVAMSTGLIVRTVGRRTSLIGGSVLLVLGLSIAYRSSVSLLVVGISLLIVIACMSLLESSALAFLLDRAGSSRGLVLSVNEMGAAIGGMIGSGLGGLALSVAGYGGLGWLLSALSAVSLVLILLSLRHSALER